MNHRFESTEPAFVWSSRPVATLTLLGIAPSSDCCPANVSRETRKQYSCPGEKERAERGDHAVARPHVRVAFGRSHQPDGAAFAAQDRLGFLKRYRDDCVVSHRFLHEHFRAAFTYPQQEPESEPLSGPQQPPPEVRAVARTGIPAVMTWCVSVAWQSGHPGCRPAIFLRERGLHFEELAARSAHVLVTGHRNPPCGHILVCVARH